MEELSRTILSDIRRSAEIEYESLGSIVHKKNEELKKITESGLGGGEQTPADKAFFYVIFFARYAKITRIRFC